MSKGLEAYKELKNVMLSSATKFTFQNLINCNDKNKELDNIIEKELKALEIIRKRTSDLLKRCMLDEMPTQEEYDLLKEVLL